MEAVLTFTGLGERALLVALASTRFAVAFLLLPLFSPETVPALVRNAMFIGMALVTLAVQPAVDPQGWGPMLWLQLFGREALIGIGFGVLLGSVLWAFETAGQIVDTKAGVTMAQITDPMAGHQTSLSGAFLSRLALFIFMAGGGLLMLVGLLVESFAIWPLAQAGFTIKPESLQVFEAAFASFALLSLMFAAPCLVVLYGVDLGLGLVNRFAPQLNLISISMSVKNVAATVVWILLFAPLVQAIEAHIRQALDTVLPTLQRLIT
jgi:type III secretion protein T